MPTRASPSSSRRSLTDGPLTRASSPIGWPLPGCPRDAGVALHVLMLASLRGIAVRGPMIGAQHAYVAARDWLGPPPRAFDRDAALAELARRYLAGHGPGRDRDLAKWAGLPLGPGAPRPARDRRRAARAARWPGRAGVGAAGGGEPAAAAAAWRIRRDAAGLGVTRAGAGRPSGHRDGERAVPARSSSSAARRRGSGRTRPAGWCWSGSGRCRMTSRLLWRPRLAMSGASWPARRRQDRTAMKLPDLADLPTRRP